MSETSHPPRSHPRARAAAALGVPADATPGDARAAFLRRLGRNGFAPPEDAVAAANAIAALTLPLTPEAAADASSKLQAEVAAFASDYWSLEPSERRVRWGELLGLCRDDRTRRRVAALEPGLDVLPGPHLNPLVEETAAAIRLLFVLGPRERAVRRAEWLASRAGRLRDLGDGTRRLRADAPDLARLEPEFVRRLSESAPLAAVPAVDSRFAEEERNERARHAAAEVHKRLADQGRRRYQPPGRRDESNANTILRGGGFFIAVILIGLVRAMLSSGTRSDSPSYYRPDPPRSVPILPDPLVQDPPKGNKIVFSTAEIRRFEEYERKRAAGTVDLVAPRWYSLWEALGRPQATDATGADLATPPWSPPAGTASTRR
ncbi:MAG: hypothetical protein JWO38_1535 [Gemmataceae bacterium]|nr:hypothetical protein [Gemmataceae bacterium]